MKEDAAQPEFWDRRFREDFTPWDACGVPAALEQFLRTEPRGQRALIPGCGSGYEVSAFAQAGFDVLAVDFAEAAIERARRTLGPLSDRVRLADFFESDFEAPFDIVYERAFLCALPGASGLAMGRGSPSSCVPEGGWPDFFSSTIPSAARPSD